MVRASKVGDEARSTSKPIRHVDRAPLGTGKHRLRSSMPTVYPKMNWQPAFVQPRRRRTKRAPCSKSACSIMADDHPGPSALGDQVGGSRTTRRPETRPLPVNTRRWKRRRRSTTASALACRQIRQKKIKAPERGVLEVHAMKSPKKGLPYRAALNLSAKPRLKDDHIVLDEVDPRCGPSCALGNLPLMPTMDIPA